MGWRDRLRKASFRGIPFFVQDSEAGFTRNVVEHEYPGQAPPFFEDMGRRARVFDVEGYVLGEDYQAQRDRLIDAAEEEGPGELVHPYFGTMRVLCRGLAVRETNREGRLARLAFSFVEASDPLTPAAFEDPGEGMVSAVGSLFDASGEDFTAAWNPADEPGSLFSAGAAQAGEFWDYLRALQLRGPIEKIGEWRESLESLTGGTLSGLQAPAEFAASVTGLLAALQDAIGAPRAALEAFFGLLDVRVSTSFGGSTASQAADANRDAVGNLFREAGAALGAQASAAVDWPAYQDALAARERALGALTRAQESAGDSAFRELANVGRALAEALPLAPGVLPQLETYDVLETTSTLVLAYRLWDDVARAEEIAIRNRIPNPASVPGGTTLEVLSRA